LGNPALGSTGGSRPGCISRWSHPPERGRRVLELGLFRDRALGTVALELAVVGARPSPAAKDRATPALYI